MLLLLLQITNSYFENNPLDDNAVDVFRRSKNVDNSKNEFDQIHKTETHMNRLLNYLHRFE